MPRRVEQHPDMLLRLMPGHGGAEGNRLGDRGLEVTDLEVEMHHRALPPRRGRPLGGLIIRRLLENEINGSLGGGHYGVAAWRKY